MPGFFDSEIPLERLLLQYIQIHTDQRSRPIELDLPVPSPKPKRKENTVLHVDGIPLLYDDPYAEFHDNASSSLAAAIEIDHETHRKYFEPPLQVQRNRFLYDKVRELARKKPVKKLAVLGCGELSFEKYSCNLITDPGVENIVSVDLDEVPLARGLQTMDNFLAKSTHEKRDALPVHLEVFKGNVLNPSSVLSNVDVAVSTEVIEHMPVESATLMLKAVLEQIHPRAFILSTPNHEYNEVFDDKTPGTFRHDDHHFEFSREEFHDWLSANVKSPYSFEIFYVGLASANPRKDLSGATQFAVITKDGDEAGNELPDTGEYKKVGDFVYCNAYNRIFESVVVGAFFAFIKDFAFADSEKQHIGDLRFWRIPVSTILDRRVDPRLNLDGEESSAMFHLTDLFPLIAKRSHMPGEGREPAISIPGSVTREEAVAAITRKFQ